MVIDFQYLNYSIVSNNIEGDIVEIGVWRGGSMLSMLLTLEHLNILSKYNKDVSYINTIWKNFIKNNAILIEDKEIFEDIILDGDGILWTRDLDEKVDLIKMLEKLGCVYMFVGHSVVEQVKLINDHVWYTDTGISRAFGNTSYQYIDIVNNQINIKNVVA